MSRQGTLDRDELARRGLRIAVAALADELHWAIDAGTGAEDLHERVALWEVNHEDADVDALAERGAPSACADCGTDTTPYDGDGRPVAGGWEWYMLRQELWDAIVTEARPARFLCLGCVEGRLGRPVQRDDLADVPLNRRASGLETPRLRALLRP